MEKRKNISLSAMEEADEAKKQPSQNFTNKSKFNEKNYLNVKLAKGEDTKTLRIRLLPIDKDSNVAFKEVHMHTIMLNEEQVKAFTPANGKPSKWKSYVCLEKEEDIDHENYGKKCPFCETQRDAYAKKLEAEKVAKANGIDPKDDTDVQMWQKISLANKADESGMCRCIDRDDEEYGPKFWKMRKDTIAQIKAIARDRKQESIDNAMEENGGVLPEGFEPVNIYDLYTGRDLKVTISRKYDKQGNPTDKTDIKITDYTTAKPLSKDEELIDKWVDDEKKWTDVFVVKDYNYLSIIVEGEVPFYDKEKEKWVPRKKKAKDSEEEKEAEKYDKRIKEAESKYSGREEPEEPEEYEEEADNEAAEDLPF